MAAEAGRMETNQCCLLAAGTVQHIHEVYLVLEKRVICTIEKATHAVAALFCSFYVFNTNFSIGTSSLFQFLEFLFLKTKVPRKPRLTRFIAKLQL